MGNSAESTLNSQPSTANNAEYWSQISTKLQQPTVQISTGKPPWQPDYSPVARPEAERQTEALPQVVAVRDPIKLLAEAEDSLTRNGMKPETKQLYQNAVSAADALYTQQDRDTVQALSNVLSTGKKMDGTSLSDAERFRAHEILNAELKSASLGLQMRLVYADQLVQTKQFGTAERVFKDSIALADQLPQDAIKRESQQLQQDMKSSGMSREQQLQLMEFLKDIPGDHTLRRPGFGYLPALTRLQTASFYVSAESRSDKDSLPSGVAKPELAMAMLHDARTTFQNNFNVDLDKTPGADPFYAGTLEKANLMLPDNLKKLKSNADSIWSNPLIDAGVGAAVVGIGGVVIGAAIRSPELIKLGIATAEGGLTFGGKAAAAGLMLGAATIGRHYASEIITGNTESWTDSTIHGAAGLVEVGLIVGARAKLSPYLFRGADSETALLRIAQEKGTEGVLTWGTVKDLYIANKWTIPANLAAVDASTVVVKDGVVAGSFDLGLNAAKSATLTRAALGGEPVKGVFARGAKFFSELPSATVENVKGFANLKAIDLMTATPQQLAWRANWSGYLPAVVGMEGYRAVSSLDRSYDVVNGGKISLAKSLENNMLTAEPLTDALMVMPFLRAGIMPSNFYAEGAGAVRRALSTARGVLRSAGPLATSENMLTQAAYTALPVTGLTAFPASMFMSNWAHLQNRRVANQYQDLLDQQKGH